GCTAGARRIDRAPAPDRPKRFTLPWAIKSFTAPVMVLGDTGYEAGTARVDASSRASARARIAPYRYGEPAPD
ncbi:MAG: hypothetical protein KGI35_12020, partial [Burkholderiales bacterium]|nr:hypothetical protein [Burkholderiales bacterium]